MDSLALEHLTTLTLDVDFRGIRRIGATPLGPLAADHAALRALAAGRQFMVLEVRGHKRRRFHRKTRDRRAHV